MGATSAIKNVRMSVHTTSNFRLKSSRYHATRAFAALMKTRVRIPGGHVQNYSRRF